MKFLNKSAKVIDGRLVIDLGKEGIKPIPDGEYYASRKYDGVLCAIRDGEMLSSSLKNLPNQQLRQFFSNLIAHTKKTGTTLLGELYSHELTFQEIISVVMTQDKVVPEHFKFFCFDAIQNDNYDEPFIERLKHIPEDEKLIRVEQILIPNSAADKFNELFSKYLDEGYEGLIIKNKDGKFKCGRTTLNEGLGFKFKNYITEDMEILDVIQATEAREGSERTINEMGYSETSKKKDDRILIDKASAFLVKWEGHEFCATISEDDETKKKIWKEKEKYIGEFVEVMFMMVGSKDGIPRHPRTLRMRWKALDE